jgi:hypothetical protein
MPEMGTSGLMSGDGKRARHQRLFLAPILDSTDTAGKVPAPRRHSSFYYYPAEYPGGYESLYFIK